MKILKAVNEKIKDCDQLGDEFKITQESREIYSTTYGGILTILVYVVALSIIFTFVRKYLLTTDPDVSQIFQIEKVVPKIDTYEYGHAPFIHLRKGNSAIPIVDYPKYFTLTMVTTTINRDKDKSIDAQFFEDYAPCR